MNNLSPAEKVRLEREKRFKNLGLPVNAGKINQGSQVMPANANNDKFKALQDIKRGAKKQIFKEIVQATENTSAGGYQIPEEKKRRSPTQAQEKSKHAVAPKAFGTKKSAEATSLESMFTGGGGGAISTTSSPSTPLRENLVSEEMSAPLFDPAAFLANKQRDAASTQQPSVNEAYVEQLQSTFDMSELEKMIYEIAEKVAQEKIKSVINDFLIENRNKKQNIYEVYNKRQNIVKIDDKLFKLTPVKIKGH